MFHTHLASIIINSRNDYVNLKSCIDSIRKHTPRGSYQLIAIDHNSQDGSAEWLGEQADILTLFMNDLISISTAFNQALQIAQGKIVVFMHSDVIVTNEWLNRLSDGLKHDGVAAVGPLSNKAGPYQVVSREFNTIEELDSFTEQMDINAAARSALLLNGFCIAYNSEIFDKVEGFDERFKTELLSISDFQLRLIEAGYKTLVLNNTFVYHYGESFTDSENENKNDQTKHWIDKWGGVLNRNSQPLTNYISIVPTDDFKILTITNGLCELLPHLKELFPQAVLCSVTKNERGEAILRRFSSVQKNLEAWKGQIFNLIFVEESINELDDPANYLTRLKEYLEDDGQLIVRVKNNLSFTQFRNMLEGSQNTQAQYFMRLGDMLQLFELANYAQLDAYHVDDNIREQDEQMLEDLYKWASDDVRQQMLVGEYVFVVKKREDSEVIHSLIEKINLMDDEEYLTKLINFKPDAVIGVICNSFEQKQLQLLNYIAIFNFERKKYSKVLPYLECALNLNNRDPSTLLNMATVTYAAGDLDASLDWLRQIPDPTLQIRNWIETIRSEIMERDFEITRLKFLLRRIEYDVEMEDAISQLVVLLKENKVGNEQILSTVRNHIIKKDEVLNRVAVISFENELYDHVIPFLQEALELSPDNGDTYFNLGFIQYQLHNYNEALYFLKQIKTPDTETVELIQLIEREVIYE